MINVNGYRYVKTSNRKHIDMAYATPLLLAKQKGSRYALNEELYLYELAG